LIRIFREYGEEKYATSIAKRIVDVRKSKKIETTLELVDIIKSSVPEKYKREKHPARKVFQAIRIEVNKELDVFSSALNQALGLLKVNGRICVITFHSLEDKICKERFKKVSDIKSELKKLPVIPDSYLPQFKIIKTVLPTKEEIENNPRARSAKLRVIERVKEG
jgi:16S rRNA (cytosine1402-N4)-methyltransferase